MTPHSMSGPPSRATDRLGARGDRRSAARPASAAPTLGLLLPLLAGVGCASVPEMESRLQTIQFHPNMYVVQAGDTLESIAFRYELAPATLTALNPGIESRLNPGQRINVRPGTELPEAVRARAEWRAPSSQAPVTASASAARADPSVRPTDTARVVVSPVASEPAVSAAEPLRDEQLLGETGGEPAYPEAERRAPDAPREYGQSAPREEIVSRDELFADEEIVAANDLGTAPGDARRSALDAELGRYVGRWTWPTDGAVAREFAPDQVGGQGVDIAGVPGQDVRAALDGTVVYSGRDLSGGGNLVIVRHDDELMTTYSHADELFVTEDDRVLAGDPIASLGWNAERESVLRFEVRRDGDPLDPLEFLPPPAR